MKIRFDDININDIIIDKFNSNRFSRKESLTNQIYSDDGIFTVLSDKIYKMKITDIPARQHNIKLDQKSYNITTDDSFFTKHKILSQIPYNHFNVQQKIITIKIQSHSLTSCSLVSYDNIINDFYFETNESVDNHSVKEDLATFLSEIYLS